MLIILPGAASSKGEEDVCNVKECCLEKKKQPTFFSLNGGFEYFFLNLVFSQTNNFLGL